MVLAIALASPGAALLAWSFAFSSELGRLSGAWRFAMRATEKGPCDVVGASVDPRTFDALKARGLRSHWPSPPRLDAQLLDRIRAGHPRAIGFDVQFTEPTDSKVGEAIFNAVA